jgi:serine/threonine protein phosphatase PrpC
MICSLTDFTCGWPAYPDVEVRDVNPDWEFLVIACDGIWDVMTNEVSLCQYLSTILQELHVIILLSTTHSPAGHK